MFTGMCQVLRDVCLDEARNGPSPRPHNDVKDAQPLQTYVLHCMLVQSCICNVSCTGRTWSARQCRWKPGEHMHLACNALLITHRSKMRLANTCCNNGAPTNQATRRQLHDVIVLPHVKAHQHHAWYGEVLWSPCNTLGSSTAGKPKHQATSEASRHVASRLVDLVHLSQAVAALPIPCALATWIAIDDKSKFGKNE